MATDFVPAISLAEVPKTALFALRRRRLWWIAPALLPPGLASICHNRTSR